MLIPVPRDYRKPRGKAKPRRPLPIPPVLTAASYVTATRIELTFDVPVNVAGLVPSAFILFDGASDLEYVGDGAPTVISPTQIQLALVEVGPTGGSQVLLTVQTANGVLAIDGGAQLEGFAALVLPFP